LKSLLASTAMDIASGGPDQRNRKLANILTQLKSDAASRGMFEDGIGITEARIIQVNRCLSLGN
jgi:hypothetical protein